MSRRVNDESIQLVSGNMFSFLFLFHDKDSPTTVTQPSWHEGEFKTLLIKFGWRWFQILALTAAFFLLTAVVWSLSPCIIQVPIPIRYHSISCTIAISRTLRGAPVVRRVDRGAVDVPTVHRISVDFVINGTGTIVQIFNRIITLSVWPSVLPRKGSPCISFAQNCKNVRCNRLHVHNHLDFHLVVHHHYIICCCAVTVVICIIL